MGVLTLYLVKYENEQKAGMVADPAGRDRVAAHQKAIADFGGKPIAAFGSYGEYDMVYIYEMPDHMALAANLHLVDSYNLAKYCKAIPLMNGEDFVESLRLAAETETTYAPVVEKSD